VKHLIQYRLFESNQDIESICNKYGIENWTINEDGSIDVDGDVDLSYKELDKIPIKFRNVIGNFYCYHNKLTSLEGGPESVGGHFYCDNNNLTSLKGCPESVGGDFYCSNNNLTSLEGGPKSVGGGFYCYNNNLTSLEGSPKSVGGNFYCSNNNLNSLEGAPESIVGNFYCVNNPVYQIWKLFEDKDKIELFNDMDIIQGDSIILNRLIYFLDQIGKPKSEEELRRVIKDYKFIL
jgi:hypothetical protein